MMLMRTMKVLISGDNVPGDVFYLLHLRIFNVWGVYALRFARGFVSHRDPRCPAVRLAVICRSPMLRTFFMLNISIP